MLQVSVNEKEGSLLIPLESKLTIVYQNKTNKEEHIAKIIPGPKKNHFIALFEDDDVDFEIKMENSSVENRSVCFYLNVLQKSYGFVTRSNSMSKLQTLQSNGRKLHFIRQSGEEGKKLVSTTATLHSLSRENASVLLSEIEFNVKYSKLPDYSIFVLIENGKKISVQVNRMSTVADLKAKIKRERGFPSSIQIIYLKEKLLHDHESMENLHIKEYSLLNLKGTVISVEVKIIPNKSVKFVVSTLHTVYDLKRQIEEKEGITINLQHLYFKGNELHDDSFFTRLDVEDSSKIFLATKLENSPADPKRLKMNPHKCSPESFPVNVKLSTGDAVVVDVCYSETIHELIIKIQEKRADLAGNCGLTCLRYGKCLKNFLTLEAYDIKDNAEIDLFTPCTEMQHFCTGKQIFVENLTGNTYCIPFCGLEKIETIRIKIKDKENIPEDQQRLICNGLQLEDGRTLNEYKVGPYSTLQLILRLRGGGCSCKDEDICGFHLSEKNQDQKISVPDFSERGAISFGDLSKQVFSKCKFESDNSIEIEEFVVELRLAAVPLCF